MSKRSIEAVFSDAKDTLMANPRVVGVGIGERAGRPCLRVFVDPDIESTGYPIPKALEGYCVDQVESGPFTALDPPGGP